MHDATLDRTTDGAGPVASMNLSELKQLDIGSWKSQKFARERLPTLDEALSMMPENVWLNVHLKGDTVLAEETARRIVGNNRLHQAFIACDSTAGRAARRIDSRVLICNMERQFDSRRYSRETIEMGAEFIQLLKGQSLEADVIRPLQERNVRINFCCANDTGTLPNLFKSGVEFVLVDNVEEMLAEAEKLDISRLRPIYRNSIPDKDGEHLNE
jgi:glycerophosphoryl diester phosphodiesterase